MWNTDGCKISFKVFNLYFFYCFFHDFSSILNTFSLKKMKSFYFILFFILFSFCFSFCFLFYFFKLIFRFIFNYLFIQNRIVPFVANFCHSEMGFLPFKIEPTNAVWCAEDSLVCLFVFTVGYTFRICHNAMQSIHRIDKVGWKCANSDNGAIRNILVEFQRIPLCSVFINCPLVVKWIGPWIECHWCRPSCWNDGQWRCRCRFCRRCRFFCHLFCLYSSKKVSFTFANLAIHCIIQQTSAFLG